MKFEKMYMSAESKTVTLHIEFDASHLNEVHQLVSDFDGVDDVEIKKRRKRRSLDQNAYMWELIGKIAEIHRIGVLEVYRAILKDYGVFEIIPVRAENVERWVETWKQQGAGWICEDLGECRNFKGYRNIKTYYGTSAYDTKEMTRMIEGVQQECKMLGIETLTPEELMRMGETNNEQCDSDRAVN